MSGSDRNDSHDWEADDAGELIVRVTLPLPQAQKDTIIEAISERIVSIAAPIAMCAQVSGRRMPYGGEQVADEGHGDWWGDSDAHARMGHPSGSSEGAAWWPLVQPPARA